MRAIWNLIKWGVMIYLLFTEFHVALFLLVIMWFFGGGYWLGLGGFFD